MSIFILKQIFPESLIQNSLQEYDYKHNNAVKATSEYEENLGNGGITDVFYVLE